MLVDADKVEVLEANRCAEIIRGEVKTSVTKKIIRPDECDKRIRPLKGRDRVLPFSSLIQSWAASAQRCRLEKR